MKPSHGRESKEAGSASGTDRRIRTAAELDLLRFGDAASHGGERLLPVIAQHASTGEVLMLAWANREALERSLESGEMHFYSRSRGELWHKGATSGNTFALDALHADCDGDAVLARVEPSGPACHTGERTCFGMREEEPPTAPASDQWLRELWTTLEHREASRPEDSYTSRLLDDENLRLKKLGEESAELIHALAKGDGERIPEEAADLLYHLLVALLGAGHSLDSVAGILRKRSRHA